MFRLPGVHCGFPVHVPDTGMRHPSQYVRQALAEVDDSVAVLCSSDNTALRGELASHAILRL